MIKLNSDRKANLVYITVMGLYYGIYSFIFLYLSIYLLANGFTNSEIGVVMALGFAITVLAQQVIANFADKTERVSNSQIQIAGYAFIILINIVLLMLHGRNMLIGVLYCMQIVLIMGIQPCLNALNFQMASYHYKMNFGIARSLGAVSYAVVSAIAGCLVTKFGNIVLQLGIIVLGISVIALLLALDHRLKLKRSTLLDEEFVRDTEEKISYVGFIRKYSPFMLFVFGSIFLYFSFAILNNFMWQVVEPMGASKAAYGNIQGLKAGVELFPMVLSLTLVMKFGIRRLVVFSAAGFFVKAFLTQIATSVPGIIFATVFETIGYGLFAPVTIYYVAELFDKKDGVKGQSLLTLAYAMGCVLSSISGGVVLSTFGTHELLVVSSTAAAVGTVLVALSLMYIDKRIKPKNKLFSK